MKQNALIARRKQVSQQYARGDVAGLAIDCHFLIDQSSLIGPVSVKKPGESLMMLDVMCRPRYPGIPSADLAAELEHIWLYDLCLAHSEEHAITIGEEGIALEFVALASDTGPYTTGRIAIDLRPRKAQKRQRHAATE